MLRRVRNAGGVAVVAAVLVGMAGPGAHAGTASPSHTNTPAPARAEPADRIAGHYSTYSSCRTAGDRGQLAGLWSTYACVGNPPTGGYLLIVD